MPAKKLVDPVSSVKRVTSGKARQIPEAGLPQWEGPNYAQVERNQILGFGDDSEMAYLKRLKIRGEIAKDGVRNKFVPPPSDLEIEVGRQLENLNNLNENDDKRIQVELLMARFNTRSIFNIAQELAILKLERQSIKELEAIVDGPDAVATLDTIYSKTGVHSAIIPDRKALRTT